MHSYAVCIVCGGAGITADDIEASYSDMLARLDPIFVAQFDSLSDLEKDVLLAISRSHDAVPGMADDIGARPTSLPRAPPPGRSGRRQDARAGKARHT